MEKAEIVGKIKRIVENPNTCGFEVYLVTKMEPRLKKLQLAREGLHSKLKADIIRVLQERYLADDALYADAMNVGDNQRRFYIIEQTDKYKPFDVDSWISEDFQEDHLNDFMGFIFAFRYDQQNVWCYQNRRSTTIANRKRANVWARIKRFDNGWIFQEQYENIVNFAHVVDVLILDGIIVTDDIGLLERSFDFQQFIHQKAKIAAESVAASKLFSGMDKLNAYLSSDARSHKAYRKKILKALDSPVLQMKSIDLFNKLSTLPRWKGKFKSPVNGKIPIETNKEVEAMIDLLVERFTISQVSGQEYDTEVKKKAEDI